MLLNKTNGSLKSRSSWPSLLHISLFSISVAFLFVSILFLFTPTLVRVFVHLEVRLNLLLGIRQTDFIRGYFAFAIPTFVLALVICSLFLAAYSRRTTQSLLKSFAPFIL